MLERVNLSVYNSWRNGRMLGSVSGVATAQIDPVVAPVTGTYLVLVGSFDSGFDGTGTYSLTVNVTPHRYTPV